MSFVAQVMQPGGGVMLLPFVRAVIGVLLILTMVGFVAGIARIHMAVLSFLGAGLLFSLSMFEAEYRKLKASSNGGGSSSGTRTSNTQASSEKTD